MDTVDLVGGDGLHRLILAAAGPHAREALAQESVALVNTTSGIKMRMVMQRFVTFSL